MSNVPDDWNAYYYTCSGCGARCHASEYGCDCGEGNVAESNRPRLADSGYELEDGEWKKLISDKNHIAKIGHNLKHCGDGSTTEFFLAMNTSALHTDALTMQLVSRHTREASHA